MSGGQQEAAALGEMATKLREAAYELRDAIKKAEDGHRGWGVPVEPTVNEILLPSGWKLVRAQQGYV